MKTYLRKLFDHDITHEVSVQSFYVGTFFESSGAMTFFNVKDPYKDYNVIINNATDPRFGGRFKSIYRVENPRIGDFLVIRKLGPRRYSLQLIKPSSKAYEKINSLFELNCNADRHAVVDL